MTRLILVPTDLSETATKALRYASSLARRDGASLLVLHSGLFTLPDIGGSFWPDVSLGPQETLIEAAREDVLRHVENNVDPEVPFDIDVVVGTPLISIGKAIRESKPDLVVLGTHGRSGIRRLVLGSVTEGVLRISPVPVLTVRDPRTPAVADARSIVCYLPDGGDVLSTLEEAENLAGRPDTTYTILIKPHADTLAENAAEVNRIEHLMPGGLANRCHFRLVGENQIAQQVISAAEGVYADLLVVAATPVVERADVLSGTTVERIVQHASCPVLVITAVAERRDVALPVMSAHV